MQGYIVRYCTTCGKDTYWRPHKWEDNWLRKRKGFVCEGCGELYQPIDWRKKLTLSTEAQQ